MNLSIDTILVPQGAEYQAVCRGLKQANCQKTRVISIPIGVNNPSKSLEIKAFYRTKPQRVLMMGLCGGLSPKHSVGDVVLYRDCYDRHRHCCATDTELTDAIERKLQRVSIVTALTFGDRPICQAAEKLDLAQTYSTSVVDMEGYVYLEELQKQNIAVAMLRVVSDDAVGDIPNLDSAIDCNGNLKVLPIAIAMLQQPIAATRLIRGSLTGLKVLQQVTAELYGKREKTRLAIS
jgi:nucleoside phosphorylase